jgi:hypothetical protein
MPFVALAILGFLLFAGSPAKAVTRDLKGLSS